MPALRNTPCRALTDLGRCDHRLVRLLPGHVPGDVDHPVDLRGPGEGLAGEVHGHHRGPLGPQPLHRGPPDAGGGAGDGVDPISIGLLWPQSMARAVRRAKRASTPAARAPGSPKVMDPGAQPRGMTAEAWRPATQRHTSARRSDSGSVCVGGHRRMANGEPSGLRVIGLPLSIVMRHRCRWMNVWCRRQRSAPFSTDVLPFSVQGTQ